MRSPDAAGAPDRHPFARALSRCAALILVFGLATGCATRPPADDPAALAEFEQVNDPLEPFNRAVFEVNDTLDRAVLEPVARVYRFVLPDEARDGIRSALSNLNSPVVFANDLFQFEFERAGITLGRFVINSTVGILGFIDVAEDLGLPEHDEDFGQTLAVWGVDSGPYLMLPLLGPSNPRDTAGRVVDFFLDPIGYFMQGSDDDDWELATARYARQGLEVIALREGLLDLTDELRAQSIDYYAAVRAAYRQRRASEIANAEPDHETDTTGRAYDFEIR